MNQQHSQMASKQESAPQITTPNNVEGKENIPATKSDDTIIIQKHVGPTTPHSGPIPVDTLKTNDSKRTDEEKKYDDGCQPSKPADISQQSCNKDEPSKPADSFQPLFKPDGPLTPADAYQPSFKPDGPLTPADVSQPTFKPDGPLTPADVSQPTFKPDGSPKPADSSKPQVPSAPIQSCKTPQDVKKPDVDNKENKENVDRSYLGCKPGTQYPVGTVVHGSRPNQDANFDEEGYSMRCFSPETKNTQKIEAPSGQILTSSHVQPVTEVSKSIAMGSEEEEEEGDEVIISSLNNKGRLHILRKEDDTQKSGLKLIRTLNSSEKQAFDDCASFFAGFFSKSIESAFEREIDISNLEPFILNNSSEIGVHFFETSTPLIDRFSGKVEELATSALRDLFDRGNEPDLTAVAKCFEKLAESAFRDGFSWNNLYFLLSMSLKMYQRLEIEKLRNIGKEFVQSVIGTTLANLGFISWLNEKGGWIAAPDGLMLENKASCPEAGAKCKSKFKGCSAVPTTVWGAAGAAVVAGAAYYFLRR